MALTLSLTVGYLPQPFATPADTAGVADVVSTTKMQDRAAADQAAGSDQVDAVLIAATTSLFGGNFGGNF